MTRNTQPPHLPGKLLSWFSRSAYTEDLLGDAEEIFQRDLKHYPVWRCKWNYWIHILSLIGSYAITKRKRDTSFAVTSSSGASMAMFISFFKVAVRNLRKHSLFTFINLLALSVGMSVSLLMIAVIADVQEYDRFHEKYDRIYRVVTRIDDSYQPGWYASSPAAVRQTLNSFSDVEYTAPVQGDLTGEVRVDNDQFPVSGYFVTPDFFRVFDFGMKYGDAITSLENEQNILVTESEARRLFGSAENVTGRIISVEPYGEFIVAGILNDHPAKSHLQFGMLASYARIERHQEQSGAVSPDDFLDHFNYFSLRENGNLEPVRHALDRLAEEQNDLSEGRLIRYRIEAVPDINFGTEYRNSPGPQWDGLSMMIFGFLAFLILAPACVNYANLTIARSLTRSREIGLRKVAGGQKKHIFFQFIAETMVMFGMAFLLGWTIFLFLRTEFLAILAPASRAGLSLEFSPMMAVLFLAFLLTVSLLIALFPAIHFARIKPLQAIQNKLSFSRRRYSPGKILLTAQFTLSLGFIMAVAIILDQYQYTRNYSMGFQRENVINITLSDMPSATLTAMLDSVSYVESLSYSSGIIGSYGALTWLRHPDRGDSVRASVMSADPRFILTHDIPLIAGTNLSENQRQATSEILVNETFAETFSSAHEAIGQDVQLQDGTTRRIAGVMKDFHYGSLREEIGPFLITYTPDEWRYANLRVTNADNPHVMADLKSKWKERTESGFTAELLDDYIEESYYWYFNLIKMVGFLGILAISISSLGLLGMVVFTISRREKEVGIRKVHGASVGSIVLLLSREYVINFLFACLIGLPLTTLLFNKMMPVIQHYSTSVGLIPGVISVLALFLIAGGTIGSQTIKAARTNPADTLRAE